MSSPGRSPARRSGKSNLPTVKGSPQTISPYRKAAAESARGSWKSTVLPAVSAGLPAGPAGPAGPVEGPLSPDPMAQARESKALTTWMQAAQTGDAEAQNNLGVSYFRGMNGVQKNAELAANWWIKSASLGFAEAQYNLAVCMLHGKGLPKDDAGAVKMLKGASEQDHPEAMCLLASLYADGRAGLQQNKGDALALYTTAARLGSEDAQYKRLVMEDLVARETELDVLQKKIGNINDGFIQLQLERAANEEVSHAYKGAGFFLSNMKSETPARARIEQAKRAESEIHKLRHQIVERDHMVKTFTDQLEAGKHDMQALLDRISFLEEASNGTAGHLEALNEKCKRLEASEIQLKNHVKDLLAENTELRAVADWAKNQRVEALKQALASVVKTTIHEQNEREKQLRTELQSLRRQLGRGEDGRALHLPQEQADDSSSFLKRVRRDMLMQEILLKEILMNTRREEDYFDQVEFLKEAVGRADDGEKLLIGACEEILDRVETGTEDLTDEETKNLRDSLMRIMKSVQSKARPGSNRPSTAVRQASTTIDEFRSSIARISESLIDVHQCDEKQEDKLKRIAVLQRGVTEISIKFEEHKKDLPDDLQEGSEESAWIASQHAYIEDSIAQLFENVQGGLTLSVEATEKLLKMNESLQTPESRIGTAGSQSPGRSKSPFRPKSANRGTMTDAERRRSHSPKHAKHDTASSPVNFQGKDSVDASLTLQVIQESIAKLGGGQNAERFDEAMDSITKRLDKVLVAVRGDDYSSRGSSRPVTPGGTPLQGHIIPRGSDAGSQVDESEFRQQERRSKKGHHHGKSDVTEKLAQEQVGRIKAELEKEITKLNSQIELIESEKRQLELEKQALDAECRLAKNESRRDNLELEALKKNVEQQIAFEKAMLRDEIKAAHESADKAVAERDKAINDSTALVTHMENELERKKEAFEESARKISEANQEIMRDVMESFASKVAVHLSVIQSEGGGNGGNAASEDLLADMAKQMDSVKKEIGNKHDTLVEMLNEMDTTLKISTKRQSRSSMGSRGDGLGISDAVRNGHHPGVAAPLPPEEMDAIKADLHFAVAGAMKNVLDEHKNGVVLLNMPDHNKPAGFMHGDGAGMLQHTIAENMREQRKLHSQLADDMEQIRMRFSKLEEKMNIQLSSIQNSAGGEVLKKEAKATTKLLYAVQAENGSQSSIESRLLPSLEQDALSESVDEMKELLQSWYRSFSFVSRLQHAVKR